MAKSEADIWNEYYASRRGTTAAPLGPLTTVSRTGRNTMTVQEQRLAVAEEENQYPFAHSPRPVFQNGRLIMSSQQGLYDANGNRKTPPSGELYYNLDKDPTMYYGSLGPSARELTIRQLVAAGFLDEDYTQDFVSVISALEEAMYFSNVYGLELNNALQQRVAGGPIRKGGKRAAGPVQVYQQSSPADLLTLVKSVSQQQIGRELTDQEAAAFISDYQSQQVAYQRAAYGGGVVTEPPSAEVAAINYLKNRFGREESAYQYLGYMNMFFDSIGVL